MSVRATLLAVAAACDLRGTFLLLPRRARDVDGDDWAPPLVEEPKQSMGILPVGDRRASSMFGNGIGMAAVKELPPGAAAFPVPEMPDLTPDVRYVSSYTASFRAPWSARGTWRSDKDAFAAPPELGRAPAAASRRPSTAAPTGRASAATAAVAAALQGCI
eukprot:TRINITY_DN47449_c0_g1_i2.p2 TRINITY_DN47449_c0_g1~~TRINITY_DN47449_c0_g1_i2.p2  ORF type:complete len:161 (+),score=39.44 TRINITY_DN47449_c0_g1_i2:252-734(+)